MSTYTLKHAIVDFGFIDAICYFGGLSMEDSQKDLLLDSIEAVESLVMNGSINGGEVDPHRNAKLLHHLGWIRGVLWKTPIPLALSEAIDRVINFATGDKEFACEITQGDEVAEPKEHQLSPHQRHVTLATGGNGDDAWSAEFVRSIEAPHVGVLDIWRRLGVMDSEEVREELAKGSDAGDESACDAESVQIEECLQESLAAQPAPPTSEGRGSREWTPDQRAAQAERARNRPPLVADGELEAVKADWEAGIPFDAIGSKFGCSGGHIRNFLKKHGIDPNRGRSGAKKADPVADAPAEAAGVCEISVKPDVFAMLTGETALGVPEPGEPRAPLH